MIHVTSRGGFAKTDAFLRRAKNFRLDILQRYGEEGVRALSLATPKNTGETASSWYYQIKEGRTSTTIEWLNRHVEDGVPIAVIIQYGHGTNGGGYVEGIDYINPAMRPIFEEIANSVWREVSRI